MLIFCAAARECNVRICTMADITHSYRIRAYPNGAQRRLLDCWFGGVRRPWNTTLEIRSTAYRECGLTLTGNNLSLWLTQHGEGCGVRAADGEAILSYREHCATRVSRWQSPSRSTSRLPGRTEAHQPTPKTKQGRQRHRVAPKRIAVVSSRIRLAAIHRVSASGCRGSRRSLSCLTTA
jgi:hypothetical protein